MHFAIRNPFVREVALIACHRTRFSICLGWHCLLWNSQNVLRRRHVAAELVGVSAGKAKEPECSESGC